MSINKIKLIKAEIERLKNELSDNKERLSLGEIIAVNNCYNNLLLFIDSLEEDPVSNDLEEAAKIYEEDAIFYATRRISDFFKAGAQWQKERMLNSSSNVKYD